MNFDSTSLCERPIFIVGSPRSGSTILAYALDQHPRLWTSGETHFLWQLYGAGNRLEELHGRMKEWPGGSWVCDQQVEYDEFAAAAGLGMNALYSSRSKGRRWIDQTPYYVYMAPMLKKMFPGAQFLHVLRDGRSIVSSMLNYGNAIGESARQQHLSAGRIEWSSDFRSACREWRKSVEAALAFEADHADCCHTVHYGDLSRDPEKTCEAIFRFLQIDPDPRPAHYVRHQRVNSSFPTTSGAKTATSWPAEQQAIFDEEAGELSLKLGFTQPVIKPVTA